MTPEEKLLRAIFGEKASDVRDTSLRVPPGVQGTVVEVRVFNRHGVDKDERALAIEREEIERLAKDRDDEQAILDRNVYGRLSEMLEGRQGIAGPKGFKKDSKITKAVLEEYPRAQWWQFASPNDKLMAEIEAIRKQYDESKKGLEQRFLDKVEKLQRGDELPPGVMKMVKVFVAVKRKIQPGDKMAGRHGNKGVVSRIVPIEDMPFLEDGTHVDIVLNPLGVPSRMNVGQILETHLGWACAGLGLKIGQAVELYNAKGDTKPLKDMLKKVYGDDETIKSLSEDEPDRARQQPAARRADRDAGVRRRQGGRHRAHARSRRPRSLRPGRPCYDGRTGEQFDRKVTVGYIYMLKLHHLVDDKIHARSIGPYSLVTQQPLGGKAQFGGQRFGEMEVWALEAYGAAYTLQEMLTVKSDDVAGRTKVYEAIVRGDDTFEAGIPESFNVLVKEMRSLGLNVDLHNSKQAPATARRKRPSNVRRVAGRRGRRPVDRQSSDGPRRGIAAPARDRGEDDEPRNYESLQPAGSGAGLRPDPDFDREPGEDSVVVLRRDQKAGDHQLPHLQARARRPVLRAHLRADQGLRVLVRQVQAHEVQGHHLREVLGRGDAQPRAARAHGPHRARGAGRAHLVPEVAAVAASACCST